MKQLAILATIAVVAAACGGRENNATVGDTVGGAVTGGVADTGMTGDTFGTGATTSTDTGASATGAAGPGDKANQTKSGVTDTKTGETVSDTNIKTTRPDQGQAVTSKGDTLTKQQPPR